MLIRVADSGRPAFQLRRGEEGISVFDSEAVSPPLTDAEVLTCFREGSQAVVRSANDLAARGLRLIPVLGSDALPPRLRDSHAEIRPGPAMTRAGFKQALKELE